MCASSAFSFSLERSRLFWFSRAHRSSRCAASLITPRQPACWNSGGCRDRRDGSGRAAERKTSDKADVRGAAYGTTGTARHGMIAWHARPA